MAEINLSKYGISGTTEIVHNPSYDLLFEEETKPELEGYEKGQWACSCPPPLPPPSPQPDRTCAHIPSAKRWSPECCKALRL